MRASAEPASTYGLFARATSFFRSREPRSVAALGLVLVVAVGVIDYATGEEFGPLIFYVLPVAAVGSTGRKDLAIVVAVAAGVSWMVMEAAAGRTYSSGWILTWNGAIRLAVFLLIGVLVASQTRSRSFEAQVAAAADGPAPPCPYCGSKDTLRLARNLVCRSCQRLAAVEGAPR
ncbi:MAG TPA: hypothetical protein VG318_15380 [Actinomycetota bacterium]|nr:hypothetical protein [Actinomycetota bacterium]